MGGRRSKPLPGTTREPTTPGGVALRNRAIGGVAEPSGVTMARAAADQCVLIVDRIRARDPENFPVTASGPCTELERMDAFDDDQRLETSATRFVARNAFKDIRLKPKLVSRTRHVTVGVESITESDDTVEWLVQTTTPAAFTLIDPESLHFTVWKLLAPCGFIHVNFSEGTMPLHFDTFEGATEFRRWLTESQARSIGGRELLVPDLPGATAPCASKALLPATVKIQPVNWTLGTGAKVPTEVKVP